jgi:NTP pyrophosphatase (non-canonical NTP hydrolase)
MATDWVADIQHELGAFARERDWEKYHTPRNLAALIASEAGELLALFRWDQDSVRERPEDVRHEVADVLLGILRLADVAGIDLESAAREKLALNRMRYPAGSTGGPDRPDTTIHD